MSKPERPTAGWSRDERWAEVAETHTAVVFLAGDLAWKLKKPVNLGFLDFSTLEARAEACAREVELNRRFAPEDTSASLRFAVRTARSAITWW